MAHRGVSLLFLRIRTSNGTRRYVRPVSASNGRLRPLWGLLGVRLNTTPKAFITSATAEGGGAPGKQR